MTPQERADAVDASIVRSLEKLSPGFRSRIVRRAEELVRTMAWMPDRIGRGL